MINPTRRGVDQSSGVQLLNTVGQFELGIVAGDLTPAFVVNDLENVLLA